MNKTVKDLATEALTYFERRKRNNGDEFWATKDNRPDWLRDVIYTSHADMFPDDYRYEFIKDSLDIIAEYEDDDYLEGIDNSVDIYTSGLTNWLNSRNDRVYYLTEALEEYGPIEDGFKLLAMAQYRERYEVFYSVLESLNEIINDEDEDEDEDEEN